METWETDKLPELVGSKGVMSILDISKSTIAKWQKPRSGTPASSNGPLGTYMITPQRIGDSPRDFPVWVRADIEEFGRRIGRQRAKSASDAQSAEPTLEPATDVLLENHEEVAVAESQDELLVAIAQARATGGMVRLTVMPQFESTSVETWVHPDAIRRFAPKRSA